MKKAEEILRQYTLYTMQDPHGKDLIDVRREDDMIHLLNTLLESPQAPPLNEFLSNLGVDSQSGLHCHQQDGSIEVLTIEEILNLYEKKRESPRHEQTKKNN